MEGAGNEGTSRIVCAHVGLASVASSWGTVFRLARGAARSDGSMALAGGNRVVSADRARVRGQTRVKVVHTGRADVEFALRLSLGMATAGKVRAVEGSRGEVRSAGTAGGCF